MRPRSSLSRRAALLITIVSPVLLGSVKCVFVSNPTIATARIERIEPSMPRVGEIVQFTGTGDGMQPLQFTWDFGDGTTLATGMQATHVYITPQSYRVTFTVRDASGNVSRDAADLVVGPGIPAPKTGLVLVSDAVAGRPVQFAAVPLDEDAGAVNYLWTFSDGQSLVGPQVAATFPVAGMYFASIARTNELGAIAVAQIHFKVRDAADAIAVPEQ